MSNKKEYMVISKDGLHEYNIVVENTKKGEKFSLYLSCGEQWNTHVRGELQLAMTNNGNGVTFDRKIKKLNYNQLLYIRLLINFEQQTDKNECNREKYSIAESTLTL